jgi:hypothetical protein
MVVTIQDIGDLHESVMGVRRVFCDDVVMEDEGTKRVAHVRTAHENLRPVSATEVDALSLAGLDSPPVLAPSRDTVHWFPSLP